MVDLVIARPDQKPGCGGDHQPAVNPWTECSYTIQELIVRTNGLFYFLFLNPIKDQGYVPHVVLYIRGSNLSRPLWLIAPPVCENDTSIPAGQYFPHHLMRGGGFGRISFAWSAVLTRTRPP